MLALNIIQEKTWLILWRVIKYERKKAEHRYLILRNTQRAQQIYGVDSEIKYLQVLNEQEKTH